MSASSILLFALGLALLLVGAELLVRGASRLALVVGLSPLVVGLTVVALGTSSPELAVTLRGAWTGASDVSLGNVLGSNVFNILVVLGVSSLVAPLFAQERLVRLEVPLLIGVTVAVLLLAFDRNLGLLDGALLTGTAVAYTSWVVYKSRRQERAPDQARPAAPGPKRPRGAARVALQVVFVVVGVALLALGARWVVDAAIDIAREVGLSERVIALTLVAAGTSLPEAATSVMASARGERDIAIGNAIGSCLFNLVVVLGIAALVSPGGIRVPERALDFDLPVAIAVAVACLPVFFTGCRISRWEGALFAAYYVVYVGYLLLRVVDHPLLEPFAFAMWLVALPLTAVTLLVLALQARARRCARAAGARPATRTA